MRLPASLSLLLHLLVLAVIVFGLPLFEQERDLSETAIAVNVVTLASITNAPPPPPPRPQQTAQAEPPKPEPPPPPPKPEPPPPPPPPPPPKPEPPKPEPPKPEPPKPPPPKPEPKKPSFLEQMDQTVKQVQKQKPKPKPDPLDQITKTVQQAQQEKKAQRPTPPQATQYASAAANHDPNQPISGTEQDVIRGGIQPCWSFDDGLLNARNLVVQLRVTIGGDGRYVSAEVLDSRRFQSDPAFRSAAEAGRRAVLDPRCAKIPLPPDRIAQLMPGFILNFNPKDLF